MPQPTFVAGDVLLATQQNQMARRIEDLGTHTLGGMDRNKVPGCQVKRTTYLALATNSTTLVTWQATDFDDASSAMWSSGTPTLMTIRDSGLYVVGMQLIFSGKNRTGSAKGTYRWGFVTLNGTDLAVNSIIFAGTSPEGTAGVGSILAKLVAGDVLRCYAAQDTGTGGSELQSDYGGTKMSAVRMGPS